MEVELQEAPVILQAMEVENYIILLMEVELQEVP